MEIVLNGQPMALTSPLSLAQLVEQLGFSGKRIAVERNGEIVPKSQHISCMLADQDRLEIVVAVGGG
jgi:sulfur carrier protein